MWYGKMTPELEKLYDDYYEMFGCTPDGYIEFEYGAGSYRTYVKDIKKSLKLKKEWPIVAGEFLRKGRKMVKWLKMIIL